MAADAAVAIKSYSHGHLKLLHPLPLGFLSFTKELEALLPLQVDQVETIRPLWRKRVKSIWWGDAWMAMKETDKEACDI